MSFILKQTKESKIFRSQNYNYVFDKRNGKFLRFGKTISDDPEFSPFGPEIADIEISKGKCSGACKFCLPEDKLITLFDGSKKPIQDILIGDVVISYDVDNKRIVENKVLEIYKREYSGPLIEIELEDGEVLQLTPEHEILTINRGWVKAKDLTIRDDIFKYEIL